MRRLAGGDSVRNMQIVDPLLSGRQVPGQNTQIASQHLTCVNFRSRIYFEIFPFTKVFYHKFVLGKFQSQQFLSYANVLQENVIRMICLDVQKRYYQQITVNKLNIFSF